MPVTFLSFSAFLAAELSISFMFMRSENEFELSSFLSDLLTESVWFASRDSSTLIRVSSFSDSTTATFIVLNISSFSNRFPNAIYIKVASTSGNASVQNSVTFRRNMLSMVYFAL